MHVFQVFFFCLAVFYNEKLISLMRTCFRDVFSPSSRSSYPLACAHILFSHIFCFAQIMFSRCVTCIGNDGVMFSSPLCTQMFHASPNGNLAHSFISEISLSSCLLALFHFAFTFSILSAVLLCCCLRSCLLYVCPLSLTASCMGSQPKQAFRLRYSLIP